MSYKYLFAVLIVFSSSFLVSAQIRMVNASNPLLKNENLPSDVLPVNVGGGESGNPSGSIVSGGPQTPLGAGAQDRVDRVATRPPLIGQAPSNFQNQQDQNRYPGNNRPILRADPTDHEECQGKIYREREQCKSEAERSWKYSYRSDDVPSKKKCCYQYQYHDCIYRVVREKCNSNAANFYDNSLMSAIKTAPECTEWPYDKEASCHFPVWAIASISVGCVLLLVIIGVIIFVIYKRRKSSTLDGRYTYRKSPTVRYF